MIASQSYSLKLWLRCLLFLGLWFTPAAGYGLNDGPAKTRMAPVVFDPEPIDLPVLAADGRSAPRKPTAAMARTADGKRMALATEEGPIRILDCASGKILFLLGGAGPVATCLAFSPDAVLLASAGPDGDLKLWDLAQRKERVTLKGHTSWVYALAFAPDGKSLASGAHDKSIRLWDPTTGKRQGSCLGHRASVRALAFTSDGKKLASGGGDRTVRIWDAAVRKEIAKLRGHEGTVRGLAFIDDGKTLVSAGEDGTVRFWDWPKGVSRTALAHAGEVWTLTLSPGAELLATGDSLGNVMLWDAKTGRQRGKLQGHQQAILGLAFGASSSDLITASTDDTLKRWRPNTRPFREVRGFVVVTNSAKLGLLDWVERASVTPDGRRALIGDSQAVRLWDLERGQEIRLLAGTPRRDEYGVAGFWGLGLSRDGHRGIAGGADGIVHIWDLASGKELQTFRGHTASIWGAALLPDGKRAVTGSWDRSLRLWDIQSGQELRKFAEVEAKVRSLAVSPDGKLLAAALVSADREPGYVGIFDIERGTQVRTLQGYDAAVTSVVFSSDGKRLLTGSFDRIVRLWEVSTGKELKRFVGHTGGVGAVFSNDGKWVVSHGDDQDATLRFWDIASGKQLFCSHPYRKGLLNVALFPDGRHALVTDKDGMIHVWEWGRRQEFLGESK